MKRDNQKRRHISENTIILLAVSCFFAFTLMIYGPIELYLTNINEFWFNLTQFGPLVFVLGVIVFLLLFLVGVKLPLWLKNIYMGGIFGFSLAMYIQSNFLNMDIGVLNGGAVEWSSYRVKFLINFVFWVAIISVFVCLVNEKNSMVKKAVKYLALCLTLIQGVTLGFLLLTTKSDIDKKTVSYYVSDKDIYEVSSDDNIIVFLLDMYDDSYFKELLGEEPELAETMDGFTFFANSAGNYSTTSYSIGTLMTGQYFRNTQDTFSGELSALYENCDTFNLLQKNNYQLDIYTYEYFIPIKLKENLDNYIEGGSKISDYVEFTKDMYRLTACRYFPDFVKQHAWMVGTEFDTLCARTGAEAHSVDNIHFYKKLLSEGISLTDDKKQFKFIHLDAVHYPYTMNENIEKVEEHETSDIQCARGMLKIIETYLEGMKKVDAYDNSTIIIMADHGYYWDGTLTNPILLVKPKNSNGTMQISNAPVSHHDFHPSILSFAGLNEEGIYGKSYFDIDENEDKERYFYQYYLKEGAVEGKYRLIEYLIPNDSNNPENFRLTGEEYTCTGEKINHFKYCQTCITGDLTADSSFDPPRLVHQKTKNYPDK